MIEQSRRAMRRSRRPAAGDDDFLEGACSWNEATEKYATGQRLRETIARAREDAGVRDATRSPGGLGEA